MSNNSNRGQQSPQEILKRIESESTDKKRQKTMDLLSREQPLAPKNLWWSNAINNAKQTLENSKKSFIKMSRIKENKHIAIITVFFMGAMWVSWQIEDRYDKLRRRAKNTKSFKQKQIQSENEYIQKMLAKNPFNPVPIEEEQEQNASYIFQKADIQFDTRADLYEVLEQQKELLYQEEE